MNLAKQSLAQELPRIERAQDELGFSSSESVLNILKLILGGSELSDLLAIIARLVESQGKGTLCTIRLPHADGKHLYCAAAPDSAGLYTALGLEKTVRATAGYPSPRRKARPMPVSVGDLPEVCQPETRPVRCYRWGDLPWPRVILTLLLVTNEGFGCFGLPGAVPGTK